MRQPDAVVVCRRGSGLRTLNRAMGLVAVRATSASSSSPAVTRKVWSVDSMVTVRPAWTMPTWMRCPATTIAPRLLTLRSTRTGSPTSTGGTTPDASRRNWATSAPTNTRPPGTPPKPNNPRQLSLHLRQPAPGNQPSEKTGGNSHQPPQTPLRLGPHTHGRTRAHRDLVRTRRPDPQPSQDQPPRRSERLNPAAHNPIRLDIHRSIPWNKSSRGLQGWELFVPFG